MFHPGIPEPRVTKIMSFTRSEFENGLQRLLGAAPRLMDGGRYDLSDAANGAPVSCSFDPLPDASLSKLISLPRVRVELDMSALDDEARRAFLLRFEKTFQRGGG